MFSAHNILTHLISFVMTGIFFPQKFNNPHHDLLNKLNAKAHVHISRAMEMEPDAIRAHKYT